MIYLNDIKDMIDDAIEKRDRSVSIYIYPENGITTVSIYPWPDADELYEQYQKGRISANDFREKMGLPKVDLKKDFKFNTSTKENTFVNFCSQSLRGGYDDDSE